MNWELNDINEICHQWPVAGGRVASYAGCHPFKSGILPLQKYVCEEQQPAAILAIKKSAGVTPEVDHSECTS